HKDTKARSTPSAAEDADQAPQLRPKTLRPVPDEPRTPQNDDLTISLPVQPRQPRLAWHGWDRKEAAVSVPTQIVEVVNPGLAFATDGALPHMDVRQASARPREACNTPPQPERLTTLPEHRLLWTHDNLVALQALLDERHPRTREYRYR